MAASAPDDLTELMLLYALRGLRDWRDPGQDVDDEIVACLPASMIADHERLVRKAVYGSQRPEFDGHRRLLPMPNMHRGRRKAVGSRPKSSFFVPLTTYEDGLARTSFDMLLFQGREGCLAFRFEPADSPDWRHAYNHVQMSKRVWRYMEEGCIPSWIPDSYPALPVPGRDCLDMFLSMAVAVHGFRGGMDDLIREIFQEEQRSVDAERYVERLEDLLGASRPTPGSSTGTSGSSARSRP